MIADRLQNYVDSRYPAGLRVALTSLKMFTADIPDGTYEIMGKSMYAMVQSGETAGTVPDKLELHRKYIDVQYVISGTEVLAWTPLQKFSILTPYSSEKDCEFVAVPENYSLFKMKTGDFAVFFPEDAHFGKLATEEGACPLKKVVVKVSCDLL